MSGKSYTRYASRTGRVIDQIMIPDRIEDYDHHSTLLYDGLVDGETHYIVAGEPTERPTQSSSVDVTEITVSEGGVATFTGLPDPCIANVSGPTGYQSVDVEGGTLQFSAAIPGVYTIQIVSFPYLPVEFTVHAV